METDEKVQDVLDVILEKLEEQNEKLDEIIEKLDDLGLPGSGFGIEEIN